MKKVLFVFIFLPLLAKAQDSIMTSAQMQQAIIHIGYNLTRANDEYNTGLIFLGLGVGITAAQLISGSNDTADNIRPGLYIGAGFSLLGAIIMIDSHKYIGRAGKWNFDGKTLSYKL